MLRGGRQGTLLVAGTLARVAWERAQDRGLYTAILSKQSVPEWALVAVEETVSCFLTRV